MSDVGYTSVFVKKNDVKKMHDVLKQAGCSDNMVEKMHATLMYDKSKPEIEFKNSKAVYDVKVLGLQELGNAIVLNIESPELEKRHEEMKELGFKHSFDDFHPHISLVYDPTIGQLELLNLIYNLGGFPETIKLGDEKTTPVED